MKRKTCKCPIYCKYCGAKLKRDWLGHTCPTRSCQWEHGVEGCKQASSGMTILSCGYEGAANGE